MNKKSLDAYVYAPELLIPLQGQSEETEGTSLILQKGKKCRRTKGKIKPTLTIRGAKVPESMDSWESAPPVDGTLQHMKK